MEEVSIRVHMAAQQHEYVSPPSPLSPRTKSLTVRHKDQYIDFQTITRRALLHAFAEASVSLQDKDVDALMKAYDTLSTFPDVDGCLKAVSDAKNITAVVFSNGTHSMVSTSVKESPDLKPHAGVFKDIVVVEEVKKFKPHPDVYFHLARKMGKSEKDMGSMWLISGNPFDIVGAKAVGMKACWVDRGGMGWTDKLVEGSVGEPTVVVKSLEEVVEAVRKHS